MTDDLSVRVYCDYRHMNHQVKQQRTEYQGTYKIRYNCTSCHLDYQRQESKHLEQVQKLLDAGITSIRLRDLARFG